MLRVRIVLSGVLACAVLIAVPAPEPDASPLCESLRRPAPRTSHYRPRARESRNCADVERAAAGGPARPGRLLECSSPVSVTARGTLACDALSGPWTADGMWDAMAALQHLSRIDGSGNAVPPCAWELASRMLHETVYGARTEPLFTVAALAILRQLSVRHPDEVGELLAAFMARGEAERALVDAWCFGSANGPELRAAWIRARG